MKINHDIDKIFFTADTHFGHTNIIKYCNRSFNTITEMNEMIIKKWNETIPNDAIVFHLGDFSFDENNIFSEKLSGQKFLIPGNHDKKNKNKTKFHILDSIVELYIKQVKQKIILCHYPIYIWNQKNYDSWHFHGHVHGKKLNHNLGKAIDVGIDAWNMSFPNFKQTQRRINYENNKFKSI